MIMTLRILFLAVAFLLIGSVVLASERIRKVKTVLLRASGKASWYGESYRGKKMANGKPFDPDKLTCASWEWPLGTKLRVTYFDRFVVVTVTDRGPGRYSGELGRLIDLSKAAFTALAETNLGVIEVDASVIGEGRP